MNRAIRNFSRFRGLVLEQLEHRIALAGDSSCSFELAELPQSEATRAARSVNCFGLDIYRHFQREEGNVVISPLSISTALAMAYAGAGGETAIEMEEVLHLGPEPGIHESYSALLKSLIHDDAYYDLLIANAQWPQTGFQIKQGFIDQIEGDYGGFTQSLDYGDTDAARQIINEWVEDNTNGKIEELIKRLSPSTVQVLTNALFFKALWDTPFAPESTREAPFLLEDGSTQSVEMMSMPSFPSVYGPDFQPDLNPGGDPRGELGHAFTTEGDFRVMEMPYDGGQTSMVILLPKEGKSTDDLTPETVANVSRWLDSSPQRSNNYEIQLPKFKTTVPSDLKDVLIDMGMKSAFGGTADFSKMADGVFIDQVGHKAFLEVNEQGTEAAAATFVSFIICFAEGTPVLTADGEKPIESIRAGDYVLSRDEHNVNGPIEPMVVEETFVNRGTLLELRVNGKTIRATGEHPFFVKDRGWTKARDLRSGDFLSSDVTSWVELELVEELDGEHTVYNFRVNKHHTYFVGGSDYGFAVWTHNACGEPDPQFFVDRPFHFMIRDNTTSAILFLGRIMDPTVEEVEELKPRGITEEDPTSQQLSGDANGDSVVNFNDFLILARNFGKQEDAVFAEGDFNNDGQVSFLDFLLLSENFGKGIME